MKQLTIFIILTLLVLLFPGLSLAQQPVDIECEEAYTVQSNDWLSKIAEKYFGDMLAYPAIVDAANAHAKDRYTDIIDPNLIEPGWTLCIPSEQDVATLMAANAIPIPPGLTLPELANATYSSEWTPDGTVTLTNGEYRELTTGPAAGTKVVMLTERTTYGQLNGQDGAGVVLVTNPGGSSALVTLHIMVSENDQPTEFSSTLLGERVQVNSINIQDNQIVLDVVQLGPNDPPCCPSQQVEKTFALQGSQLVETSNLVTSEAVGKTAGIVGVIWKWLGFADPAGQNNLVIPNPDNYRLELLPDGSFRAKADCNRVGGTHVVSGDSGSGNLMLAVAPYSTAICGPSSLHKPYVQFFDEVAEYARDGDNLVLNLMADGGELTFGKLNAVSGTVIGPPNTRLPVGSVLETKVIDLTNGAPGIEIGGAVRGVSVFPINFEAPFKPQAVDPQHSYELTVTIKDAQGNALYQNSQPYPVLTQDYPIYNLVVVVEAVE